MNDSILKDIDQDNIEAVERATPTPGTAGVVQRIEKLRKKPEDLDVVKHKEAHPCTIPQY